MKKSFYPKLLERVLAVKSFKAFGFPETVPYKLTFVITNKCNSHCKMCFVWKFYKDYPEKAKNELKPSEIKKIIDSVKDDIYWLNFMGGEPTLRTDLPEIVEYAAKKCKNLGMINFPCNGLMPERVYSVYKEIAEKAPKNIEVYVTLSLDGPEKVHDYMRGTPGAYKNVMKAFRLLKPLEKKHRNFHVNFQATITRYNINQFKKHFDFIQSLSDFNIITFEHEAELFKNIGKDFSKASKKEYNKKLMDNLQYVIRKIKVSSPQRVIQSIYLKLAIKYVKTKKLPIPCASSFASITVDSFGDVIPCAFVGKPAGNVRKYKYDLKKILSSKLAKEMQAKIKAGKCPTCWMNCEAYPSIFESFPTAFLKSLK